MVIVKPKTQSFILHLTQKTILLQNRRRVNAGVYLGYFSFLGGFSKAGASSFLGRIIEATTEPTRIAITTPKEITTGSW
jgi:hypothetical protein